VAVGLKDVVLGGIAAAALATALSLSSGLEERIDARVGGPLADRLAAVERQLAVVNRVVDARTDVEAREDGEDNLHTRVAFLEREVQLAAQRVARAHQRLNEVRLSSAEEITGAPYGCGGSERKDVPWVMTGVRNGSGCGAQNLNYYRRLSLTIPPP
jgi:hypothetical protein